MGEVRKGVLAAQEKFGVSAIISAGFRGSYAPTEMFKAHCSRLVDELDVFRDEEEGKGTKRLGRGLARQDGRTVVR